MTSEMTGLTRINNIKKWESLTKLETINLDDNQSDTHMNCYFVFPQQKQQQQEKKENNAI